MADPQVFDVLAEIAIPLTVTLEGDEETFTDQIEQEVQHLIGHTGGAVVGVTNYRLRATDEDCCWIGDPCPIHNPHKLGRDTSAAGHHEPVGERQGRQPAQDSRAANSHERT